MSELAQASDLGRYREIIKQHGLPVGIDHDPEEETVRVGVQHREDDGLVSWELRVCGIVHGYGFARSATEALIQASERLAKRSDEVTDR